MISSVCSVKQIKHLVCLEFGLLEVDLESDRRQRHIAIARMIGMALARRLTKLSSTQIGRRFGNRDHTTVLYACKRVGPHMEAAAQRLPDGATAEEWVKTMQSVMGLGR
jgi:chromosomal replication initiator protein